MQSDQIACDLSPFIRTYKDGRVERLAGIATMPPSLDHATGVHSKDVTITSSETTTAVSVRLYLPKPTTVDPLQKLPILIYFHGGGFIMDTSASPIYHNYLNALASEANVLAVSVNYRLAPENPLPAAYEDSWSAIKWVESHLGRDGPEEWLNVFGDFERVFLAGDSAGANIAHHMGLRADEEKQMDALRISGIILVHPFFLGNELVASESKDMEKRTLLVNFWHLACPSTTGCDDPKINPEKDPDLPKMVCERMIVFIAEKEVLRDREWRYCEALNKTGWKGVLEVVETLGEGHVFHLYDSTSSKAKDMMNRLISFINKYD